MSLLVVGSIALDTIRTPDQKVYKNVPGGSCYYFAYAARHLSPVRVVGVVGGDYPKKYVDALKKVCSDISGLQIIKNGSTFQWHGTYMHDMNNRVTDNLIFGVLGEFDPVLSEKNRRSSHVFLACSQPELQSKVLDQMQGSPLVVCDTIEFYIKEHRKALDSMIRRCQGMIANDSEAKLIAGDDNIVRAAKAMRAKYKLNFLVVKKGEHGGLLVVKDAVIPFPAYPLEKVVDPTGAGDCFAGGFMGYLAKRGKADLPSLRQAVVHGTAMASFACEGLAVAKLAKVTAKDMRTRAANFVKLCKLG